MSDGDEPRVFDTLRRSGMGESDLLVLAHRVLAGRVQYGVLDLKTDKRNFRHEEHMEALDGAFYAACEELRTGDV